MNTRLIVGILLIACVSATAQETYTKLSEDPSEAIKGHVGIELYGVDAGFKNISGSMLFTVGVTARYPLVSNKIMAEGIARFPLIRFEKKGFAFLADAGILYTLNSNDAPDDVKVILGYKEVDNFGSNTRTAITKYVNINGTVRKNTYARAGVYLRNSAFDDTSENMIDYYVTNIFHKGVYLGLGRERQYYFQLQRNRDNNPAKFGAGSIFMLYADVMILPVNVDLVQDTFGMGAGATKELNGLLGGRIGFKWYRNPFTRAQNFDRKIPFFGNSFFTMEAGVRPLEGLFVTGGFTYIIHKF
ncbi:MAG: hypothetical protein KIT62_05760 [Cyclobacteriaceae bacterium]|nr:hypothetical protein [Cyclobacteriaceae bacterium]